jgi:hypothetical protein
MIYGKGGAAWAGDKYSRSSGLLICAPKNNTAHKNDPSFPFNAESTWTVLKRQHSAQIRACRLDGSQAHPWLADSVASCGSGARIRARAPD